MKPELMILTWATVFTGVLWMPYIIDRLLVRGIIDAVGYPTDPKPQSAWAQRLMRAHLNAVENLVIFASLVLTAQIAGISSPNIVAACQVYFWARVVHALAYTLAVPWLRTLAFTVSFGAQAAIAIALLGAAH